MCLAGVYGDDAVFVEACARLGLVPRVTGGELRSSTVRPKMLGMLVSVTLLRLLPRTGTHLSRPVMSSTMEGVLRPGEAPVGAAPVAAGPPQSAAEILLVLVGVLLIMADLSTVSEASAAVVDFLVKYLSVIPTVAVGAVLEVVGSYTPL